MSADRRRRAESFAFRVGLCTLAPGFRLELIEPLDERGPYAGSLARHERARPRASPQAGRRATTAMRASGSSGSGSGSRSMRAFDGAPARRVDGVGHLLRHDGRARVHARDRPTSRPGSRCPSRSSWCRSPPHARRHDEPDGREPTPPRGRLAPPGRGAPLPRADHALARAARADAAADPDRPRRRHVVPAAVPGAARARQGLPDLGRRRQRVPRPPDRRLGDDPRPRERRRSATRSSRSSTRAIAVRLPRLGPAATGWRRC